MSFTCSKFKSVDVCNQGCLQFRPVKKCIYLIGIVQTLILCSKALAAHLESILLARPFYLQRHGTYLIICPYGKAILQFSSNWCWTILSSASFGLCYDELKCTILPNCKTCAWNFSFKNSTDVNCVRWRLVHEHFLPHSCELCCMTKSWHWSQAPCSLCLAGQMSSSEVWKWARKMVLENLKIFFNSFGFYCSNAIKFYLIYW